MGDAERVDARSPPRRANPSRSGQLERLLEPRHRHVGRVARDDRIRPRSEAHATRRVRRRSRRRRNSSPRRGRAPETARRCGNRSRRGPSSAFARSAVRSGVAASAVSKRRCASCELDPAHPERPQRDAEAQRIVRRALEQRRPSATRRLAASRSSLGEPRSCSANASAQRACRSASVGALACLIEPLARVEANGLEQAVAALREEPSSAATSDFSTSRASTSAMPGGVEVVAGAHALDRLELEATGEDREPPKQRPLVRLEQVVAPLQRGAEGLLPGRRCAARGAEHAEAGVESLGDRGRTERSQAPGCELERQRQAVEPKADAGDVHSVLARRSRSQAPPHPPARRTAAPPHSAGDHAVRTSARDRGCRATEPGTRPRPARAAARGWSRES